MATHDDLRDAVLQFLAVLAYPTDERKRDPFAQAIHAALYKSRAWDQRQNKYDSVALRTRVPLQYRKLPNRKLAGIMRRGLARLSHRIVAGNVALRFLLAGTIIPVPGGGAPTIPHSDSGSSFRMPITVFRNSGEPRPVLLVPPKSLKQAFLDVIRLKQRIEGIHLSENDAAENFRKQIWKPSLPILHLCCALYQETCRLPGFMGAESAQAGAQFVGVLTSNPDWIIDALLRAEGCRNLIASRIPGGDFEPDDAIQLLPF